MTDLHDLDPLNVSLSSVATTMLQRHLLKCAEAGLPVTAHSLASTAVQEMMSLDNTAAGPDLARKRQTYIESQVRSWVAVKGGFESKEALNRFRESQFASFCVIHYLSTVIKGAGA